MRKIGAALLALTVFAVSSCEWRGANTLPLPGTAGHDAGSFSITAELPDVGNLERNSRVRVGDVTVGSVSRIERSGWHAVLTLRLSGEVDLPENSSVKIGQTSLLGSKHVELAPPVNDPPRGRLHAGSVIPLSSGSAYPSTERTLAALSLFLNGGGIGQLQDITEALSRALGGREADARSLFEQLRLLTTNLSAQVDDIIAATESVNDMTSRFAAQKPVLDRALDSIPAALDALRDQRADLAEALRTVGEFSGLASDSVQTTRNSLQSELSQIGPVLQTLADSGQALTRSLSVFSTFPWPKETLENWQRGDYANLSGSFDFTLSRLDQGLLTGTRFEGDLTKLELQWGRTIGQLPSPYSAANPLTAPYHLDQGP